MEIQYTQNPLETKIILTPDEQEQLKQKVFEVFNEYSLSTVLDLFDGYLTSLQFEHCGDCTCVASSCSKCCAESMLGIDTIAGLGKHEASKIQLVFNKGLSLDDAIKALEDYHPTRPENSGWTEEVFNANVEYWKISAKRAAKWLKEYQATKLNRRRLDNE